MGLLRLACEAFLVRDGALHLFLVDARVAAKTANDQVLLLTCAIERAADRFPTVHVHHGFVAFVLDIWLLKDGGRSSVFNLSVAQNGANVWHSIAAQVGQTEVKRHTVHLVFFQLFSQLNLEVRTLELGALAVGTKASVKRAIGRILVSVVVAWDGHLALLLTHHEEVWRNFCRTAPFLAVHIDQPKGLDVLFTGFIRHLLKAGVGNKVLGQGLGRDDQEEHQRSRRCGALKEVFHDSLNAGFRRDEGSEVGSDAQRALCIGCTNCAKFNARF